MLINALSANQNINYINSSQNTLSPVEFPAEPAGKVLRHMRSVKNTPLLKIEEKSRYTDTLIKPTGKKIEKSVIDFSIYGQRSMKKCNNHLHVGEEQNHLHVNDLIKYCDNTLQINQRCKEALLRLPSSGINNELICKVKTHRKVDSIYKFNARFQEVKDDIQFFRLTDSQNNIIALSVNNKGDITLTSEKHHLNDYRPLYYKKNLANLHPKNGSFDFEVKTINTKEGLFLKVLINGRHVHSGIIENIKDNKKTTAHFGLHSDTHTKETNSIYFRGIKKEHYLSSPRSSCEIVASESINAGDGNYFSQLLYNC